MFGKKGLVGHVIDMPGKVIEFGTETMFGKDETTRRKPRKAPKQACPVCGGRRKVPAGFYDDLPTTAARETCRTCDGAGVI